MKKFFKRVFITVSIPYGNGKSAIVIAVMEVIEFQFPMGMAKDAVEDILVYYYAGFQFPIGMAKDRRKI